MAAVDVITGTTALVFAGFFVFRSFRKTARGCHCDGACQMRSRPDDLVRSPERRIERRSEASGPHTTGSALKSSAP